MEELSGATFDGHLTPPEGPKCKVQYRFGEASEQSLPTAVKRERRKAGWKNDGFVCMQASCSIPALELRDEEVIISIDPAGPDGTCNMLLQSVNRPELGLTVLVLAADRQNLTGGDESWSPGDPPIIRTTRRQGDAPRSPSSARQETAARTPTANAAPAAASAKAGVTFAAEAPPARASTEARAKATPTKAAPVPPKVASAYPTTQLPRPASGAEEDGELQAADVGVWNDQLEGPHAPIEGGVGRSVMGAAAEVRHAPSKVSASDASLLMQPDAIVGVQVGASDSEIQAAKADNADRLVAAAAAGELGDLKICAARVGVDTAASAGIRQEGLTPLMAAAAKGRVDTTSWLIEQGAALDAADPQGWTAVMHAIHNQRSDILQLLLRSRASAVVSGADEGVTPLHLAAQKGRPELVNALLATHLPPMAREAKDVEGRTAVHVAAKNGRNGSLVAILGAKGRTDARDNDGRTPLFMAAESGRVEAVRILLGQRADVLAQDAIGNTAQVMARTWGHERVLEVLADAAAAAAA